MSRSELNPLRLSLKTMKSIGLYLFFVVCWFTLCIADAAGTPGHRTWEIDGVIREALFYVPPSAKTNASPVVFAFHGHGGTMQQAARFFGYHKEWPEAIVVYMQGLKTPGRLTDHEGRQSGWQFAVGEQDNRDLKFFIKVLDSLKQDYLVDTKQIYVTGHSNGGRFTYLLWAVYGDQIAACAPSGAPASELLNQLKPKPVLHICGKNDPLVKFEWQKQTIDELLKINKCKKGKPWEHDRHCMIYPSEIGTPVLTYIHQLGHGVPSNATAIIVKFFKAYRLQ